MAQKKILFELTVRCLVTTEHDDPKEIVLEEDDAEAKPLRYPALPRSELMLDGSE
jgi:hypothetical protein